jgi:hypothetical protein
MMVKLSSSEVEGGRMMSFGEVQDTDADVGPEIRVDEHFHARGPEGIKVVADFEIASSCKRKKQSKSFRNWATFEESSSVRSCFWVSLEAVSGLI